MIKFCTFLIFLLLVVTTVMLFMTKDKNIYLVDETDSQGEGTALIGGDFTLVNQDGKTVSDKDFHGRVMMVFFGFTHCPEICPVTVTTFSKALKLLGDKASSVAPIFISVDPERDTPKVIKEYLSNIDSRIIGLTGTDEQIKKAASTYKAFFSKSKITSNTEYEVDHSGFIYIMDKKGVYIQHFSYDASAQDIVDVVSALIK